MLGPEESLWDPKSFLQSAAKGAGWACSTGRDGIPDECVRKLCSASKLLLEAGVDRTGESWWGRGQVGRMEARLVLSCRGATGGLPGTMRTRPPPVKVSLTVRREDGSRRGWRQRGQHEEDGDQSRREKMVPQREEGRGQSRVEALRDQLEVESDLRGLIWLWKVAETEKSSRTPMFLAYVCGKWCISFGRGNRSEVPGADLSSLSACTQLHGS